MQGLVRTPVMCVWACVWARACMYVGGREREREGKPPTHRVLSAEMKIDF